jgi:hypothetical protein
MHEAHRIHQSNDAQSEPEIVKSVEITPRGTKKFTDKSNAD